ncbi:poly-gamma-glutamate hydrolase family protein [Streptomyces alfalfae]|uniref:poly-gamma-glutamate hydrolase family protein n=1 Tax=Streptomyces alfalfae TaxID=1642299 RepID=UPI001BACF895|nr:poly-gamma-glutamate hydrolase family protein [Streptomyces alfalfae]QUI30690.1 poly-gamma-glutamate hydrolase family protein [Streptomyces alfalfae]
MADKYGSWAALVVGEPTSNYQVTVQKTNTRTSHIGIHAGGIEIGTSELAKAVSARLGQNLYLMEGLKSAENGDLHITSTRFDEPQAVALQASMERTVSYHGMSGDALETHIGGNDTVLRDAIGKALEAAGFTVVWNTAEEINGDDPRNIANRNTSGKGVQLEMTTAMRKSFFPNNDWSRSVRTNPKNRTPAFYAYVDAIASAVGAEGPPNALMVYDGSKWVDSTPQVYSGSKWLPNPPLYWDGAEWMASPMPAREFPEFTASTKGSFSQRDTASLAVPAGTRTNDYIVSLCAQQAGEQRSPRLSSPAGVMPTLYTLPSGIRLHIAAWPWEPARGKTVTWDVTGSPNTVLMNLSYRYANVGSSGAAVTGIKEYSSASSLPLMASQRFTSLYVALTVSKTLTGFAWPDGVVPRAQQLGTFGADRISLIAGDTPGGGGSPGSLALDATVDSAVAVLVTIPGATDGNATWILGDSAYSNLGSTTYLG